MKETLYRYLQTTSSGLSIETIVMSFIASLIIGLVIFVSYRFSHSSAVYSAKFNSSLIMLTLVTTLVMAVIGNNVALSLGMVGALSIVRFRTAIKDPRDTAYIFWCIAAGICCGVQDYAVAGLGSAFIFVVMLIAGNVKGNDRFLLIVSGKPEAEAEVMEAIKNFYNDKANLKVQNNSKDNFEFIYELSKSTIDKAKKEDNSDINAELLKIDGVAYANTVCQNEEITK